MLSVRVLTAILLLSVNPAAAHKWYAHRTVPGSAGHLPCCGGKDCFRVTEGEFNEWTLHKNTTVQPAQDSEDNNFHICTRELWNMFRNHWDYDVRCAFKPRNISRAEPQ